MCQVLMKYLPPNVSICRVVINESRNVRNISCGSFWIEETCERNRHDFHRIVRFRKVWGLILKLARLMIEELGIYPPGGSKASLSISRVISANIASSTKEDFFRLFILSVRNFVGLNYVASNYCCSTCTSSQPVLSVKGMSIISMWMIHCSCWMESKKPAVTVGIICLFFWLGYTDTFRLNSSVNLFILDIFATISHVYL